MKKVVKIPKSFSLFASDFKVILKNDLYETTGWDNCNYTARNQIVIHKGNKKGERISDDSVIESFFQRLANVLFYEIGLGEDNTLPDLFGKALHQFFKTAEYDLDIDEVIPIQFSIFGRDFTINFTDTLYRDSGNTGLIFFSSAVIHVEMGSKQYPRDIWRIRKSFFHELVHAIFDEIEYQDYCDDEKLVDLLANELSQIIKTMKY